MKREVSIHIGGLHASRVPTIISTLLGSCVAACLYDPETSIGGMNHILLPGKADLGRFDPVARYAINAMELLINRIMRMGGSRTGLVAKVFGGASMLLPAISEEKSMGWRNAEFVLEFLHMERIEVISRDLGGHQARRVLFHTDTGDVFLKRLPSVYLSNIQRKERKSLRSVQKKVAKPARITLFE